MCIVERIIGARSVRMRADHAAHRTSKPSKASVAEPSACASADRVGSMKLTSSWQVTSCERVKVVDPCRSAGGEGGKGTRRGFRLRPRQDERTKDRGARVPVARRRQVYSYIVTCYLPAPAARVRDRGQERPGRPAGGCGRSRPRGRIHGGDGRQDLHSCACA
jgi:hypothetical protein